MLRTRKKFSDITIFDKHKGIIPLILGAAAVGKGIFDMTKKSKASQINLPGGQKTRPEGKLLLDKLKNRVAGGEVGFMQNPERKLDIGLARDQLRNVAGDKGIESFFQTNKDIGSVRDILKNRAIGREDVGFDPRTMSEIQGRLQGRLRGDEALVGPQVSNIDLASEQAIQPFADQQRTGFREFTTPQVAAAASARGLGRSSVVSSQLARESSQVERDIASKRADLEVQQRLINKEIERENVGRKQSVVDESVGKLNQLALTADTQKKNDINQAISLLNQVATGAAETRERAINNLAEVGFKLGQQERNEINTAVSQLQRFSEFETSFGLQQAQAQAALDIQGDKENQANVNKGISGIMAGVTGAAGGGGVAGLASSAGNFLSQQQSQTISSSNSIPALQSARTQILTV